MNLSEEIYKKQSSILNKLNTLSSQIEESDSNNERKKELIEHLDKIKIDMQSRLFLAETALTIKPDKKGDTEKALKDSLLEIEAAVNSMEIIQNMVLRIKNKKENENKSCLTEVDEYEKARKGMNDFWKIYADKKIDIIDKEEELKKKLYKSLVIDLYNGFLLKGYDTMELSVSNLYFVEILDEVIKEYPFLTYSKNIVDGRIMNVYVYPVKN